MLIHAGIEKILICTPSNAAVDEVLRRLSNPDEILAKTQPKLDLVKQLLRIGATEYKPDSELLKYTLDEKVRLLSGEAKLEVLTAELELMEKLIKDVSEEGGKKIQTSSLLQFKIEMLAKIFDNYFSLRDLDLCSRKEQLKHFGE